MKLNLGIIILILLLSFSCKNERNLNGNYSICFNEEYSETYFKNDSMRVASESEWVRLSEWRKIELNNDTINFETFGEWRDNRSAKINYVEDNIVQMQIIETEEKLNLIPIKEKLNFENSIEFWNGFEKRKVSSKCNLKNEF